MLAGIGWLHLDSAHNIHSFDNATECRKALTVCISFAAEIKGGLVSDTDEEVRSCGVRSAAGHGNRAVRVQDARDRSALQRYWRETLRGWRRTGLDDLDLHVIAGLIIRLYRSMKEPAVIKTRVNITKEVGSSSGRVNGVNFGFNAAEIGIDNYGDETALGGNRGNQSQQKEC